MSKTRNWLGKTLLKEEQGRRGTMTHIIHKTGHHPQCHNLSRSSNILKCFILDFENSLTPFNADLWIWYSISTISPRRKRSKGMRKMNSTKAENGHSLVFCRKTGENPNSPSSKWFSSNIFTCLITTEKANNKRVKYIYEEVLGKKM